MPTDAPPAVDWYRLADSSSPVLTLMDPTVSNYQLTLVPNIRVKIEPPVVAAQRECEELPAASSAKNWESVADPAPALSGPLAEGSVNSLLAETCHLWRGTSVIFGKSKRPAAQTGRQLDDPILLVRYDCQNWTKTSEVTVSSVERIWDASPDGSRVLVQPAEFQGELQRRIDVVDIASGSPVVAWEPYTQHDGWATLIAGAAFIDSNTVVTCSKAGELVWWHLPEATALRRIWHPGSGDLLVTPGRKFVGVFNGQSFCFYDAATGAARGVLEQRQQHFLTLQAVEFKQSKSLPAGGDQAAFGSAGGDELIAWGRYGANLDILMRWSLRDGQLLNFMPVPGPVGSGLNGLHWLNEPFVLIGDWVADLRSNRFVGKIDGLPVGVSKVFDGPDGRLWAFNHVKRMKPLNLEGSDFFVRGAGEPLAPLPLSPFATVKLEVNIPARPKGTLDFEADLISVLAAEIKSWGTKITPEGKAAIKLDLNFSATGRSETVQIFRHTLFAKDFRKPVGSMNIPEYLLAGSLRWETESGHVCYQMKQSVSSLHIDLDNYPVKQGDQLQHDLQAMVWNGWNRTFKTHAAQFSRPTEIERTSQSPLEAVQSGSLGSHQVMFFGFKTKPVSYVNSPSVYWKQDQTKPISLPIPVWKYGQQAEPETSPAGNPNVAQSTNSATTAPANNNVNTATNPTGQPQKDPFTTVSRYQPAGSLTVEGIKSLVMPPASRIHFATVTRNGTFQAWDPRTLKVYRAGKHEEGVESLAYCNSGNGLVYATTDQKLRIFDIGSREQSPAVFAEHKFVKLLSTTAGSTLVAGAENGKVVSYRLTAREIDSARSLCDCEGRVTGLCFVGSRETDVAVTATDGKCRIVNLKSGKLEKTIDPKAGGLLDVAASRDGDLLAIATFRDGVQVFNPNTNEVVKRFETGRPVYAVRFSKDGKHLLTGSDNSRLLAWRLADGQAEFAASGLTGRIREIHFSEDGLGLAAVNDDGAVKIWKLAEPPKSNSNLNRLFP